MNISTVVSEKCSERSSKEAKTVHVDGETKLKISSAKMYKMIEATVDVATVVRVTIMMMVARLKYVWTNPCAGERV